MRLRALEDWWLRFEPVHFCCADDDDDGGGDDGGGDDGGGGGGGGGGSGGSGDGGGDDDGTGSGAGGEKGAAAGSGSTGGPGDDDDGGPASSGGKDTGDTGDQGGEAGASYGSGSTGNESSAYGGGTGGGAFGGDARDTGRYDGGDGGGLAAGTDPGAGNVGNEQAGLDNASLGFGNDQTGGQGAAAAGDQAPGAQAGGQFGADARDIANYGGTSAADVTAMKAGLGSNVGGNIAGEGDIQTALTGSPNVAAALSQAGNDPTLQELDTPSNPAWSGYNVTGTLQGALGAPPGTLDQSQLTFSGPPSVNVEDQTGLPAGGLQAGTLADLARQFGDLGTMMRDAFSVPAASVDPNSLAGQLGYNDIAASVGKPIGTPSGDTTTPMNFVGNAFAPGETIMPDTPPGPQTVDSTQQGILSTAPVGLGGPFQAGPGNALTGNQAVDQAVAAGEFSGNLPSWTDMTALSPNVNSPANSVAAALGEGLAYGGLPAGSMTNTPATLTGGLVGKADPGMLSGTPMQDQAPVDFNQITPATGINPNDPNQTIVAKTQPAASQATSSFQEQADTLAPWAFAGTPTGPAKPAPAPSPAPAPDNQKTLPDTQPPAPTPAPTTQGPTAPTEPGSLTPDVTAALESPDGASDGGLTTAGSSTAPVGPPPLTAADLSQPIPVISQPDTPIPPADGGLPSIPNIPLESDGPNFNPESGLFGSPGTPGGAANQVVNQSLPGGVQGPVLGPIMDPNGAGPPQPDGANQNPNEGLYSVLNNAIDTGDGANISTTAGTP